MQKPTDEKRHLMRLWVAPENDWELPQAFTVHWGGPSSGAKVGDRGGIHIPNSIPRAPLDAGRLIIIIVIMIIVVSMCASRC